MWVTSSLKVVILVRPRPTLSSAPLCVRTATSCWRAGLAKLSRCPPQRQENTDMLRLANNNLFIVCIPDRWILVDVILLSRDRFTCSHWVSTLSSHCFVCNYWLHSAEDMKWSTTACTRVALSPGLFFSLNVTKGMKELDEPTNAREK